MFAAMKLGNMNSYVPSSTAEPVAPSSKSPVNSQQDSGGRKFRPQVKVMNIPENTNEEDLKVFFSSVAEVKGVKILPLREGRNTTMGFVDFETDSDVQKAVQEKNDADFNGEKLRVFEGNRSGGGGGGGGGVNSSVGTSMDRNQNNARPEVKVFNIPGGTGETEIKDLFAGAGTVTRVRILPCRDGKDVTLGFVHYETVEEVEKAVQMFHEYDFKNSNLRVMSADGGSGGGGGGGNRFSGNMRNTGGNRSFQGMDKKPMGRGAALYANANRNSSGGFIGGGRGSRGPQAKVFGIPIDTNEDQVQEIFSSAGKVVNVKILPLREGKDSHLGFIEFTSDAEVQDAVTKLNNMDLNGSTLKVIAADNNSAPPSNGISNGNSFEQSAWKTGPSNPTMRLPKEHSTKYNGANFTNGDIQLDQNFNINEGGGGGDDYFGDDGMPRMAPVMYIPPPPPETEEEIFNQQQTHEGINFDKYEHIPVTLTGNDPPKPITEFSDANLNIVCNKNILRAKYNTPTPVQKYALPSVIAKRDLMACAQTGSGKTASFLLPVISAILNEGVSEATPMTGPVCPLALVIAPTRELAVQILNESLKFSFESKVKSVVLYGGVSVNHQTEFLRRGCHICIATPGRLEDFVKRGKISFRDLKFMILDEADRMLDMGFGPQISNIIDHSEMPPKGQRTTLMFSATFPDEIQKMAANFLHDYLFLTVGRVGVACSDVQQTIIQLQSSEKRNKLEEILQQSGTDRTLVFVERKKDADFLATFLSQRNYPTTSLNGDRSQQEREAALLDFRKGKAPVLVATAVAARGLDIDDVKHVINYDLPRETTEYVHRIGRTGRIGNKGKATSFFDPMRDQHLARHIVKMLSEAEQNIPEWLESIALEAVGTGYGQDRGSYRDRRPGGGRSPGRSTGGGIDNGMRPPPRNQIIQSVPDDDDEEW